jgi:F0F1-type ATP synthase membrane subunit c/vacuolar-type H+-ATPase subunit K
MMITSRLMILFITIIGFGVIFNVTPVLAIDSTQNSLQVLPQDAESNKFLAAAIAFSAATLGAGWAISRAGSAGLAAAAERPEIRTTAIIIAALGEAIAIYGIVIAFVIMGG